MLIVLYRHTPKNSRTFPPFWDQMIALHATQGIFNKYIRGSTKIGTEWKTRKKTLLETFNDFCFNWEQTLIFTLKNQEMRCLFFKKWTNLQVCCQAPSFETNISCHDAKRVEAFRGLNSKHFRNGKMGHNKPTFQWWISMWIFVSPPGPPPRCHNSEYLGKFLQDTAVWSHLPPVTFLPWPVCQSIPTPSCNLTLFRRFFTIWYCIGYGFSWWSWCWWGHTAQILREAGRSWSQPFFTEIRLHGLKSLAVSARHVYPQGQPRPNC